MSTDVKHTETSVSPSLIDLLCLRVIQMSISPDLTIFVLMTTDTTNIPRCTQVCLMSQSWDSVASMHDHLLTVHI